MRDGLAFYPVLQLKFLTLQILLLELEMRLLHALACKKYSKNIQERKREFCLCWIRDVFWLGLPAPHVLGSDKKNIQNNGKNTSQI